MNIYADNAATTRMSKKALYEMNYHLENSFANPSSSYMMGQNARRILDKAREDIAGVIGASPREIIFTSGGSEGDNQAIVSAARLGAASGKKHIVSSSFEHHAVLNTLKALEKQGYEITLLDVHPDGIVRPEEVEKAIKDSTALVSIMYANNETGTLQPIDEIGKICKKKGVLFHTDAVQALGHVPVNVENIDLLSASAHKFHGPKGTGFLYAKKGIRLTSLILGGAQERGQRAGTENLPAICAMACALKEAAENMEESKEIMTKARDLIIKGLSQIEGANLNVDAKKRLPGHINFSFEDIAGESLLILLDQKGICASSGSACMSGSLDPSHVLLAMGQSPPLASGALRLTIGADITEEQTDYIIKTVKETVEYLRSFKRK